MGSFRTGKIRLMPRTSNSTRLAGLLALMGLLSGVLALPGLAQPSKSPAGAAAVSTIITNLAQLTSALDRENHRYGSVRLEGIVCAVGRPGLGVLVLQDETGVELLELGRQAGEFLPGERIRIEGDRLLLRRRDLGMQISAAPVVDNDGIHALKRQTGSVVLQAGRVPLEVGWFNRMGNFELNVGLMQPNGQPQAISETALSHLDPASSQQGETNLLPGLRAEAYEGSWEEVPNFDLLRPVKTGTTPNFALAFRPRDELVGIRFTGYLEVPKDGTYTFSLSSDDGALLFAGHPEPTVQKLGRAEVPGAAAGWIGQPMNQLEERRWLSVEGRVSSVWRRGEGLELELRSGVDSLSVSVADAEGLDAAALLDSRVRATGVGRAALSAGGRIILSRLCLANGKDLLRAPFEIGPANPLPLVAISQVQKLTAAEAARQLPVRVRGVVTTAGPGSPPHFSLQDDTRGIFVECSSNLLPRSGEFWEVVGHTAPGKFAPIIVAEKGERLGRGTMPEPARPSWNELANGSMTAQWVEFRGVVSEVRSNQLTLLLPEGTLEARIEGRTVADLQQYQSALVRVRGALFASWNADTREVQFGSVLMRNATVSMEVPPPADPFEAPARSARDLLRFEVQAGARSLVKVRAQVLFAGAQGIFAVDEGTGLRVQTVELATLSPGDWFEAVGFPEISGPSPLLRHALVRKTGTGTLPAPRVLAESDLRLKGLDSTLVAVEGILIGTHSEQGSLVLEMQANRSLFAARLGRGEPGTPSLRPGSRLRLTGVYAQSGSRQRSLNPGDSFELLVNSAGDIQVLSQPSWWTLKRLGAVLGLLLLALLLAAVWITQLRRKVEQRTAQLRQEIRQREHAERQHAIEAERSRIARDLHDDLGSGLSEINLLVGTHQRRFGEDVNDSPLFRNIAAKTRRLISALDVIVWAVDPEDNSLQSLADYLNGFVAEFLSHSGLTCRLKVPVLLPSVTLDGQVRHGVLMAVKEALNNIVRHAAATEVEFRLAAENALTITITDNGKGFDVATGTDRHGLKNLSTRLSASGGSCQVNSIPGQGTTVEIVLPLNLPAPEQARTTNVAAAGVEERQ
jgi:signal transduction histidine kinase